MPKLRYKDNAFDLAINEAKKSCMQHKHGSIIFNKNGQVIGSGHNFQWTLGNIWSCHAEIAALNSLSGRDRKTLSDCTLVVVRLGGDLTTGGAPCLKMSKPCRQCAERIRRCNIKYCFYSA